MIRPAERFAVNIPPTTSRRCGSSRPSRWSSLPMLIALAAVSGAGIGGMLPVGLGTGDVAPTGGGRPRRADPAAIEPAAGPGRAAAGVARAPDRRFYAPVLLDRIPVTMQLEPDRRGDAAEPGRRRQAVGRRCGERRSCRWPRSPWAPRGSARCSCGSGRPTLRHPVLGADMLDRLGGRLGRRLGGCALSPR